jgi:hypothetical protein
LRLSNLLQAALEDSDFEVRLDTSIRLKDSRSMPRPDILVMDQARRDAAEPADIYPPIRKLAIGIFSPATSKKAFPRSIEIYLNNGAVAGRVLQPDSKNDQGTHIRRLPRTAGTRFGVASGILAAGSD